MKNIGINVNTTKDPDKKMVDLIVKTIKNENRDVNIRFMKIAMGLDETESSKLDVIIVLGGDGTILNTSRHIYKYNIPILGINMGT